MAYYEWQFDGLVGPTHNYAGLATGNMASAFNKGASSNPRNAALQGIAKMRYVAFTLGMKQAFFPPHYRPLVSELKRHGFSGDLGIMLDNVYRTAPELLSSLYSSSYMWAANAATVTSSVDNNDGRLHLTPANLVSHYHRSIEASFQKRNLDYIFHNKKLFAIDNAIPSDNSMGDEGAANHMVINKNHDELGTHIFVYGKSLNTTLCPKKFNPRQSREASEIIARGHGLNFDNCLFLQQSPEAIDLGVFHNDVIAMNTTSRMIIHEQSYIMDDQRKLHDWFAKRPQFLLREIRSEELSVADAVSTYLFNSQMLELPSGKFALVAPSECSNHAGVGKLIESLLSENVIDEVHYLDVRESMRNGGGPACLRLRIVLSSEQEGAIHSGIIFTTEKVQELESWVNSYYRDRLEFDDLRDVKFVKELDEAYDAFESIVQMPGLYDPYRL